MDLRFEGAVQVYGIPEHTGSLALGNTRNSNGVLSDPYRLYNLDVFEYEVEQTVCVCVCMYI